MKFAPLDFYEYFVFEVDLTLWVGSLYFKENLCNVVTLHKIPPSSSLAYKLNLSRLVPIVVIVLCIAFFVFFVIKDLDF